MTTPTVDHAPTKSDPWLPPRWFIRGAWVAHRAIHRFTGGRRGLSLPKPGERFGHLKLTTIGRRSGQERAVILGYIEDGPNLVTLAMNGWGSPEPAWWLNLQAQPDANLELKTGIRSVRARAAIGQERERLWAKVREHRGYGDMDGYSRRRSGETAVVVLEPRDHARLEEKGLYRELSSNNLSSNRSAAHCCDRRRSRGRCGRAGSHRP